MTVFAFCALTTGTASAYTIAFLDFANNVNTQIVPDGIGPNDSFQVIFVSSTKYDRDLVDGTADSSDNTTIAQWNALANTIADASTLARVPDITWSAVASTSTINANANALIGQPVYRTDGTQIASGYADFWDSSIPVLIEYNENGVKQSLLGSSGSGGEVWTGSNADGTKSGSGYLGNGIGNANVGDARNLATYIKATFPRGIGETRRIYGLSEVITIADAPTLSWNSGDANKDWNTNDWTAAGWQNYAKATFDGSSDTVTVSGSDANVYQMNFLNTSTNTINGPNALNFGINGSISVDGTSTPTINAAITGAGNIDINGGGRLAVTGDTSIYTGTMTVSQGTLDLDSSSAFGGDLLVKNAAHLATKDGVGSINLNGGTLTLEGGSILDIDISGATADSFGVLGDTLVVSGGTGPVILSLSGTAVKGTSFTIFGGSVTAFDANDFLVSGLAGNWVVSEGSLVLTLVPEPSTAILAGLGLMGVCFRRRRK